MSDADSGSPDSKSNGVLDSLIRGASSGACFATAVGAIGAFQVFGVSNAVTLAALATIILAGALRGLKLHAPFESRFTRARDWLGHGAALVIAVLCLWGVTRMLPASQEFLCEPLVPWSISIAAFGAFALAWIGHSIAFLAPARRIPLMIFLAFFWIAPFFGFFHAPWFLAQVISAPCAQRPIGESLAAVIAMVLATEIGRWAAVWIFQSRN